MSKVGVLLALSLTACTLVYGQTKKIDSLEAVLRTRPADSVTVDILLDLSGKYVIYKPALAKQYAEDALQISQDHLYRHGEVMALNCIADYEYRSGNYARAIEVSTKALRLSEQSRDSLGIAMANRALGNTYTFGFKQYSLALKHQLNALKIVEGLHDRKNIATLYGNITWIYAGLDSALDEAHRLARQGIIIADSLGDWQRVAYNYNSEALIYFQESEYDSALSSLKKSNAFARKVEDRAVTAYNKSIEGKIYLRQGKFKEALVIFNESLAESKALPVMEIMKDSYDGISEAYKALDNYKLAYENHMRYMRLRDSLINWETTQRALLTTLQFEGQQKITELEQANIMERNEQIIYDVLFGIIIIFFVAVVLLAARNNRHRKLTNKLLQEKNLEIAEQNQKLKEVNDIKDKFFSIISHDLRSPLTSLKGLLTLLAGNEINEEEFKSFAPKLNQRLMGVSETLENLLHWSQSQMKGMTYNPTNVPLKGVIDKCLLLFAEAANEKKLTLSGDVPREAIVYADKNQADLIFRNLIHNGIKFTQSGGKISVTAIIHEHHIEISITDTGIGMTSDQVNTLFGNFTARTTHGTDGEKGTGLGLLLCKEMAENNGGSLHVTSEKGKGSSFKVSMKKVVPV